MTSLPFDSTAVRALAGILAETGLTEIEIEGSEGRIRVVRSPTPPAAAVMAPLPPAVAEAPIAAGEPDDAHHPGAVLNPIAGIVHLAPEPGAPPFAAMGQTVAAGQTVLLIEAMKTFSQIKVGSGGTVARILVASGQQVELGQPLLIMEQQAAPSRD